ncbi:sensor histidine kinase [Arcticibacter sp. MXS-1]|uniref:sensor histidine kinase n=1 Tax=Arcticibacter sp. MXS-1 TaxID=3341726 RepID=UPI0035A97445
MKRAAQLHPYLIPLGHFLFWVLVIVLLNVKWIWGSGLRMVDNMQYRFLLNNLILIVFFYLNAYFLYPQGYKKRGLLIYVILVILSIVLFSKFSEFISHEFFPVKRHWRGRRGGLLFALLPYIFILGISTSYRIVSDFSRREKELKEKENETLKSELAFLRSQVSPHFMFNVLNSLVSLARKKSDLMEPSLIQLSGLMRYMLYESDTDKVPLEQEIKYLKAFVDLQMLRFGDDIRLTLQVPSGSAGYEIEPMLLIPLIENAFKHGLNAGNSAISIKLNISRERDTLWLEVENTVAGTESSKDRDSGIGLHNMRRRLELLYNGRYTLETMRKSGSFVATLKINLK